MAVGLEVQFEVGVELRLEINFHGGGWLAGRVCGWIIGE